MNTTTKLMTVAEVATALRISPETVRNRIRRDDLPAVLIGGQWRIDPEALALWIRAHSNGSFAIALNIVDGLPALCPRCGEVDQLPGIGLCHDCHLEVKRQADTVEARRLERERARRRNWWHTDKGRAAAERRNAKRRKNDDA